MYSTVSSNDRPGEAYIDAKTDDMVAVLKDPLVRKQLEESEPIELWDLCRGLLRDVQRDTRDHYAESVARAVDEPARQRQGQRDQERELRRERLKTLHSTAV